ncbi:hypothetical protein FOMG_19157 [Fusarium oxysporum f. sp. melonis 26406]|uniref:Uncharacterized protein n=1 Tax=Fusarium oxysporum f. sp. melonis 26406 TaxID=1089452 RepID=W9YX28_FUSOX|nr:hypothetical protein FOMG_19157 [Fusarium oxysporum f. sp. melonis 26406]
MDLIASIKASASAFLRTLRQTLLLARLKPSSPSTLCFARASRLIRTVVKVGSSVLRSRSWGLIAFRLTRSATMLRQRILSVTRKGLWILSMGLFSLLTYLRWTMDS